MTLQQLQYIVSIDRFRSFAKAAEHCGVAQPTLSKMVAKLEDELDVRIFERTRHTVKPTSPGKRILKQAEKTIQEASRIQEIVIDMKNSLSGELRIAIGPSIAPYLLPRFIHIYGTDYPEVSLSIEEMRIESMLESLGKGETDIAIATSGHRKNDIFEIPLYEEPFWVYVSDDSRNHLPEFTADNLSHENMWVMKEAQCLRESAFSFCKARETGRRIYEAGNIETLVRVVDANGGFTIIPEMHLPMLSEKQRGNVKALTGDCVSMRRVSIYISCDFVREKILNSVVSSLVKVIPHRMLDSTIVNGKIRL